MDVVGFVSRRGEDDIALDVVTSSFFSSSSACLLGCFRHVTSRYFRVDRLDSFAVVVIRFGRYVVFGAGLARNGVRTSLSLDWYLF